MREIKFRQWIADEKEMRILDNFFIGVGQIAFSDTHWADLGSDDEESSAIMQYTGLKDKNGVEIYEGDIVRVSVEGQGIHAKVIFQAGAFVTSTDSVLSMPNLSDILKTTTVEVIGNIYSNPELLEASHDS